jgi:uncharacterized cupin superfamily protein
MPVIADLNALPERRGTTYPPDYADAVAGRVKRILTEPLGLTQFGVNLTTLEPGAMSSQRHWHTSEDEVVYVVTGELTLVTKEGETVLRPGMVAGFPAGDRNGHHLINRSPTPATYLEIGTRAKDDEVEYPDIDMKGVKRGGQMRFSRKNGEPFA